MEGWLQAVVTAGVFIVGGVGALIVWELKRIHSRIDKYTQEMDEHIKESTEIRVNIQDIQTKQDMHMENGHRHKED